MTKKNLFIIVFALLILIVVIFNNRKANSLFRNKKYTLVTIINAETGKNQTKYTFYFNGKYRNNYSKLLWKNERDSIIGTKALIEYDSTNLNNSKIIFEYNIPQNIVTPINGWKNIPKEFSKK